MLTRDLAYLNRDGTIKLRAVLTAARAARAQARADDYIIRPHHDSCRLMTRAQRVRSYVRAVRARVEHDRAFFSATNAVTQVTATQVFGHVPQRLR